MKKYIFITIIILAIIIVVSIVNKFYLSVHKFDLSTEYKYIIHSKLKYPPRTNVVVTTYKNQYYEIDLAQNRVDVREDSVKNGKNIYKRKLITKKILTDEETEKLTMFLENVMKEGKKTLPYYKKDDDKSFIEQFMEQSGSYYLLSSKEKQDIIMYDNNMIREFLEIVKLELEPDRF